MKIVNEGFLDPAELIAYIKGGKYVCSGLYVYFPCFNCNGLRRARKTQLDDSHCDRCAVMAKETK